ncbi:MULTISPECIES: PDR/VanB family oxidoreductase [Arthrobacter]|uniref:Oxidoreductase n=1 Tax=Arthrobacter terricola TaxID=2547396 RepID=A0A4R5KB27_9MICC|nr:MULTISPECIES: PDR/VanB family oxidoreductase [Arthrobacter]MBT8163254.1 PDR/VanB family oxidoreductase [Arthrobacter sp. GN70]TDF91170.1 oxidoreductase [Arthrobacter terricola]
MSSDPELTLEITGAALVADGVRSLRLARGDRAALPGWEPGAHLEFDLPNGQIRHYSLCNETTDANSYEVAVLLAPESRGGSEYIHNDLQVGDLVTVRGPRNNFPFAIGSRERALFIAGGIGITPILPMIRRAHAEGIEWSLVYGGRSRESMAYLEQLQHFGSRVQIVPQDELGHIDLQTLLGVPQPDTKVFCCGPSGLLDAVQQLCRTWPDGTLHLERFAAGSLDASVQADAGTFTVVAERSGVTCEVGVGESITDALGRAGIIVPTSCREGICGTCETKVIAGIPDHRDFLLGDADRESGATMLICVSRAKTPELILDV